MSNKLKRIVSGKKAANADTTEKNITVKQWFFALPCYLKLIYAMFFIVLLYAILMVVFKLFSAKPKSYEAYLDTAEEVLDRQYEIYDASGAYKPLDQQMSEADYMEKIIGVDNKEYKTATEVQVQVLRDVQQHKKATISIGGISEVEELESYANSSPVLDETVRQAVAENIAIAQGLSYTKAATAQKDYEDALEEAIYEPIEFTN